MPIIRSLTNVGAGIEIAPTALSTTPLGSAGVWTSDPFGSLMVKRLVGTVFADQSGTLKFQYSFDNVNWYDLSETVAVTASTIATFDQEVFAPVTRAVYTNGGTAQTVFRISVSSSPI
jgi:hypothetical protein